jgi:hypothetical protein
VKAAFQVEPQHLIIGTDGANNSSIDLIIAGSKRQYGLPRNTRFAIAEAKRSVPACAADVMTVKLRVFLMVQQANGTMLDMSVISEGSLEIASNRHQRYAVQQEEAARRHEVPEPCSCKRPREEEPCIEEQLRSKLAQERQQRAEAMQMAEAMQARLQSHEALATKEAMMAQIMDQARGLALLRQQLSA